ncbi:MAG: hypothetical protein R3C40_01480 [Parvularculaceae bacterium]
MARWRRRADNLKADTDVAACLSGQQLEDLFDNAHQRGKHVDTIFHRVFGPA